MAGLGLRAGSGVQDGVGVVREFNTRRVDFVGGGACRTRGCGFLEKWRVFADNATVVLPMIPSCLGFCSKGGSCVFLVFVLEGMHDFGCSDGLLFIFLCLALTGGGSGL